jgi:hypothetical protein
MGCNKKYLSNMSLLIRLSLQVMTQRGFFFIGFVFCFFLLFSKPRVSRYEFFWALRHPFAAMKVKRVYHKAYVVYQEQKQKQEPDSFSVNGKLDAFRHIFFMAAFSQKIKSRKLVKLGVAHEKANYKQFKCDPKREKVQQDSLSTVMDLTNNLIGIQLGRGCRKCSLDELRNKVLALIYEEKVCYILRNNEGRYISASNEEIPLKDYKGKWFIPFVLIEPKP